MPAIISSDTNTNYDHFNRNRTTTRIQTLNHSTADKGHPSLPNSPLTTDHKGKVSKKRRTRPLPTTPSPNERTAPSSPRRLSSKSLEDRPSLPQLASKPERLPFRWLFLRRTGQTTTTADRTVAANRTAANQQHKLAERAHAKCPHSLLTRAVPRPLAGDWRPIAPSPLLCVVCSLHEARPATEHSTRCERGGLPRARVSLPTEERKSHCSGAWERLLKRVFWSVCTLALCNFCSSGCSGCQGRIERGRGLG
jgi:hypothetical protein